jgi:rhodanese-related sulfurtransferase
MNKLKKAILQAAVLVIIGCIVAFAHNAASVNGINPFRKLADFPVSGEPGVEGIRFIGIDEVIAWIEEGAILIDARTGAEYEEGHIPGAILFDYYEMGRYMQEALPLLDPARRTIVYCYGPDCEDAEFLSRELYMLGFTDLFVFGGGYEAWVESGEPIEGGVAE